MFLLKWYSVSEHIGCLYSELFFAMSTLLPRFWFTCPLSSMPFFPGIDFPGTIGDFLLYTHFCISELLSAYLVFCKSSVVIVWESRDYSLGVGDTHPFSRQWLFPSVLCPSLLNTHPLSCLSSVQMSLSFAWDTLCSAVLINFTFTWRLLLLFFVLLFFSRLGH